MIHSQADETVILNEARKCLALYYEPEMNDRMRAEIIEQFLIALGDLPEWAIIGGFEDWIKSMRRRPSPAEIRMLAQKRMDPIINELSFRERQKAIPMPSPERDPASAEQAARAMHEAGYTPKKIEAVQRQRMAASEAELYARVDRPSNPHWTETADPDGKEMRDLRAARDANPLVIAARRAQYQATGIGLPDENAGPEDYTPPEYADEGHNG